MSVGSAPHSTRRVREQARDALAVMALSAVVSGSLALVLLLLMLLGRQA
ncbi:MAG: hypothetical protein L0H93_01450 [Nocardioides sp.]|nr:hypothetical protein [Nocardioides sp.]